MNIVFNAINDIKNYLYDAFTHDIHYNIKMLEKNIIDNQNQLLMDRETIINKATVLEKYILSSKKLLPDKKNEFVDKLIKIVLSLNKLDFQNMGDRVEILKLTGELLDIERLLYSEKHIEKKDLEDYVFGLYISVIANMVSLLIYATVISFYEEKMYCMYHNNVDTTPIFKYIDPLIASLYFLSNYISLLLILLNEKFAKYIVVIGYYVKFITILLLLDPAYVYKFSVKASDIIKTDYFNGIPENYTLKEIKDIYKNTSLSAHPEDFVNLRKDYEFLKHYEDRRQKKAELDKRVKMFRETEHDYKEFKKLFNEHNSSKIDNGLPDTTKPPSLNINYLLNTLKNIDNEYHRIYKKRSRKQSQSKSRRRYRRRSKSKSLRRYRRRSQYKSRRRSKSKSRRRK
jgi:hypothetical protein